MSYKTKKQLEKENEKLRKNIIFYLADENKISCAFDTAEIETIGIIDGTQFAKFLLAMRNKLDGKYGDLSYVIGKIINKLPIYKIPSEGKK